MKKITNFTINRSDLTATVSSTRSFTVTGEKDAEFILQVFDGSSPVKFYDFISRSFATGFISTNNLKVKMNSGSFNGNIKFPVNASGDTYTILLLTPPDKDTELSFSSGKNSYSTTITQVTNAILTFTPSTATATAANYQTFPTTTSTGSSAVTGNVTKAIGWDVENTDSDAKGFGLRLIRQPVETDWYFTPTLTYTIVGAVSGNEVVVDDLTDLCTGMHVTAVAGGSSLSGTPTITDIDIDAKILTISSAQTFANGHTLTFEARGSGVIRSAIGAAIDFINWTSSTITATEEILTKTVRGVVSDSTTVTLNGTRGISGGDFVRILGVNVNNTSTNLIQTNRTDGSTATASNAAGEIIVDVAQTFVGGEVLTFVGCTKKVTISNDVIVKSHPLAARIIYLNLDNFITVGVQTTS